MIQFARTASRLVLLAIIAVGCGSGSSDPVDLILVRIEPGADQSDVARNRRIRLVFNTTVLPSSVTDQSIQVRYEDHFGSDERPVGYFIVSGNVVEFDPTQSNRGGANSLGFRADETIRVAVVVSGSSENLLRNIEGNPIQDLGAPNLIRFQTGEGWDDPVAGPPSVIGIELTPPPDDRDLVSATAAVTLVFTEPIDPESVRLGENVFLRNDTLTSPLFRTDIPATVVHDGSLTRYSFVPDHGYGEGPYQISVDFIDRADPRSFDPYGTPRDLSGHNIQNFTFKQTFQTIFDPSAPLPPPAPPPPPPSAKPDSPIAFAYIARECRSCYNQNEIVLSTSDGSTTQVLVAMPAKHLIEHFDWSPDLDRETPGYQGMIVFCTAPRSVGPHGAHGIWVVGLDGSPPQLLLEESLAGEGTPAYYDIAARVSWSPDGTRIAYYTLGSENELRLLRVKATSGSPGPLSLKLHSDTQLYKGFTYYSGIGPCETLETVEGLAWQPDVKPELPGYEGGLMFILGAWCTKKHLAVVPIKISADGVLKKGEVYAPKDSAGSRLEGLVHMAWSPDGRSIVAAEIAYVPNTVSHRCWEIGLEGSPARRELFARDANGFDWSPDGKHWLWSEYAKIYRMSARDSVIPIEVTGLPGVERRYPSWNPHWRPDIE